MVSAKIAGIYLSVQAGDIQIFLENQIQGIFSVQVYITDYSDTIFANTVSDLLMMLLLGLVTTGLIVKHNLYRKSQEDPRTIVKLTRFNIIKWVTDQDKIFIKIFVWSFFTIAAAAITIANAFSGNSSSWLATVAFFFTVLIMWGLIRTFEYESDKIYPRTS